MLALQSNRRSRSILVILMLVVATAAFSLVRPRAASAAVRSTEAVACYKATSVVKLADSGLVKITAVDSLGAAITFERMNIQPHVAVGKTYWVMRDPKTKEILDIEQADPKRCTFEKKK
jgi:hypothetical protein